MSGVELIVVPYDSGLRGVRMGAGPERLIELAWPARIQAWGHDVHVATLEADSDPPAEVAVAFELAGKVAAAATAARGAGRLPVILSGNCASAVGVVAALGSGRRRVLWFDSHGDLNTPETTRSGFLDGMTLSVVLGRCWSALARTVPGFQPLRESAVTMVGIRDLDPEERTYLSGSDITTLPPDRARAIVPAGALPGDEHLADTTGYVHLDVDAFDPSDVGPANAFAASDGLTVPQVQSLVRADARRGPIGALTVSAYDPDYDEGDAIADAALAVVRTVLETLDG